MLDGVDLVVRAGQCVAIVGPNGAGKTSLLRAVAGRLRLDGGLVRVAGVSPRDARRAGAIGVVPQEIALFPDLTVRENLMILARLAGVLANRAGTAVNEALRWADLESRATSIVRTLSGGMRRRVNLLAGLLHDPWLLLLDEPTVGIDQEARARLLALLRTRCDAGMAALMVTHDAQEVAAIGDRVAVLVEGRVIACDTPAALTTAAFPDGSELTVTLADDPEPLQRLALGSAGLASRSCRQWSGPSAGLGQLASVVAGLGDAGMNVAEVRLQPPTLDGAVARLIAGARS